ncbi:hypothetical protein M8C21_023891, partial [Ambrosia artemisiifolia]
LCGIQIFLYVIEIFKNHVDEKGRFKENLCKDVQGMLALYEATYMRVEGEQLLDEALEFTKTHLAIIAKDPSYDSSLRAEIQQALKQPLRKKVPRLEALRYMPIYQQQPTHNEVLLKLAKLDFNILQAMHKKELSQLCKYAKEYIDSLFLEAKWFKEGYIPTLEEYMPTALITVTQALMIARAYVGRGDMVTEETFRWIAKNPPIVKASSLIFRLMDDIATHEVQYNDTHTGTFI